MPPLKPTKRLEVLWKTAAKHFRDLALDESHIAMSIADRRGAVPTHVFTAGTHAQMTPLPCYTPGTDIVLPPPLGSRLGATWEQTHKMFDTVRTYSDQKVCEA